MAVLSMLNWPERPSCADRAVTRLQMLGTLCHVPRPRRGGKPNGLAPRRSRPAHFRSDCVSADPRTRRAPSPGKTIMFPAPEWPGRFRRHRQVRV
jgi:hypothetical protein